MVNPSESFNCQVRKVKWIAHCMLHPSGTKARAGSPLYHCGAEVWQSALSAAM